MIGAGSGAIDGTIVGKIVGNVVVGEMVGDGVAFKLLHIFNLRNNRIVHNQGTTILSPLLRCAATLSNNNRHHDITVKTNI